MSGRVPFTVLSPAVVVEATVVWLWLLAKKRPGSVVAPVLRAVPLPLAATMWGRPEMVPSKDLAA